MRPVLNILSVEEPGSNTVHVGTEYEKLLLPDKLKVTLSNEEVIECNITWSQGAYNPDVVATYILKGKIEKPEGVTNTDGVEAKISINVRRRSSGKLTSQPTKEDVDVKYDGETLEITAKENIEEIKLKEDILTKETNNMIVKIDNISVILNNDPVDAIKKETDKTVSVTEKDNTVSVKLGTVKKAKGIVSYKPESNDNFTENNVVVTKDGEIVTNSYYDGNKVVFEFNGSGDYKVETRSHEFSDTQSSWAKDTTSQITELGLISGFNDGTLKPNSNTKRSECAAVMTRLIKLLTNNVIK